MDYINMKNMEFFGHVGCLEDEKINGQTFVISVKLGFDGPIKACKTDLLSDTVDYSMIYHEIEKIVREAKCDLIEFLASLISDMIFEKVQMVDEVVVAVSKPQAPITGVFETMEVEIRRKRNG